MKLAVVLLALAVVQKDPTASAAWAEAGSGSVAVYASIDNPTMYDVYLVSGKSDAAGTVELISAGKPVANIPVPAYGSAELKPGAAFVRLSDLKRPVQAGEQLTVTVDTDGGVAIAIAAIVK